MKNYQILLLSRYDRLGASSRVRFYQYIPYLKAHGIDVTIAPFLPDSYIKDLYAGRRRHWATILGAYFKRLRYLLKCHDYDLLWVEYEFLPWMPPWAAEFLARLGVPYIVDYDDAQFHNYGLHPNVLVRTLLGSKIGIIMKHAAAVTVGNEYLADYAKRAEARRVLYLPTVVDLEKYHVIPKNDDKIFIIGWIGSPTTAKYLELIRPALAELTRDGRAKVIIVGSGPIRLDDVELEIREWSENTEVNDIEEFDVGVMPLHDSPWERGKCGYKLIQYMACGRAVVGSPVGVNKIIIEENINGYLAETESDWINALKSLRDDPALRRQMGESGRHKVEGHYSLQVTAPLLLSLFNDVVNR